MGAAWTIYGIGLKGPEPSWKPVPGRTVLQDPQALVRAGVLESQVEIPEGATPPETAEIIKQQFQDEGWTPLAESDSAFGQAASEAGVLVEETEAFSAGEYQVVNVFDIGGERYPKINDSLDFLAFFHKPHHVVVEVAPLVPTRTEPGRAPASAEIDETRTSQYVYMVRDLGARRQPAIVLFVGSTTHPAHLCVAAAPPRRVWSSATGRPLRRQQAEPWSSTCRSSCWASSVWSSPS